MSINNETQMMIYLKSELWKATISAALGRSNTYIDYKKETKKKSEFKDEINDLILSLINEYNSEISEEIHIKNIEKIIDISKGKKELFNDGEISFGVAQKILNLYLKYLWCLDIINTPPHCPIDRKIIMKLPIKHNIKWTSMNKKTYINIIESIRKINPQIAMWELQKYNEK